MAKTAQQLARQEQKIKLRIAIANNVSRTLEALAAAEIALKKAKTAYEGAREAEAALNAELTIIL